MIWLGERRGCLSDWVTQQWVRATGRRVRLLEAKWLSGPTGGTRGIGSDFFEGYAKLTGRIDCWSEWSSIFRPFGRLLAIVFSRRLQQLNVPLTGLDTSLGSPAAC
jgi:hypothetical protein